MKGSTIPTLASLVIFGAKLPISDSELAPMTPPATADSGRNVGSRRPREVAAIWKVHSALTAVQCLYAGANVVQKFTFTSGMNPLVFSVYRDVICVCFLTPLAFFSEKGRRTPMDWIIFGQIVLLGFLGMYISTLMLAFGISLAPAAYASLVGITCPIFVFLISAATRLEDIQLTRRGGLAKALGVLSAVCGGVLIPLYNGPVIINSLRGPNSIPSSELPRDVRGVLAPTILSNLQIESWQLGALLLILTGFMYAIYWTLQAHTMKRYPAPISIAAYSYAVGSIFLTSTGLLAVRDYSSWAIPQPSAIIALLYVGLLASGVNFAVQSWASFEGGPVLLASYGPVQSFANVIMAYIFLGESIHLGSVLAFLLIINGLYFITWGQVTSRKEAGHPVKTLPSTLAGNLVIKGDSNLEQHLLGAGENVLSRLIDFYVSADNSLTSLYIDSGSEVIRDDS